MAESILDLTKNHQTINRINSLLPNQSLTLRLKNNILAKVIWNLSWVLILEFLVVYFLDINQFEALSNTLSCIFLIFDLYLTTKSLIPIKNPVEYTEIQYQPYSFIKISGSVVPDISNPDTLDKNFLSIMKYLIHEGNFKSFSQESTQKILLGVPKRKLLTDSHKEGALTIVTGLTP